jgi:hypothetical protein
VLLDVNIPEGSCCVDEPLAVQSKRQKATKRNVVDDSDHELPGAKLRAVLPDSAEEDHAGGGQ